MDGKQCGNVCFWATFAVALSATLCLAQEYRATLLGVVTDPSGATITGASVSVVNIETQVRSATESNSEGNYLIPYLVPGQYRLRIEHAGFKSFEQGPITLRVNDRTRLDIRLEIGQVTDRVTVTAEAPLLEVASSSRGQVIETRRITDLPVKHKNPYDLLNLAVGVQFTGPSIYGRPFDYGSIGSFSINGGRNMINEYQIDGIPNNINLGWQNIAYVPPVEATQEFKVLTNSYDSQYGHTGGGIINLSIKPGTNRFHGAAYEYLRRTGLDANKFVNNATGVPRPPELVDQYGFELDGPVLIPRLYHGKDRTFFMFAMERFRDQWAWPGLGAVPTELQHRGDFSQTFNSAGKLYTIYDPLTVRANPAFDPTKPINIANLQFIRTPFDGNQVPQNRFEPIATNVLSQIPLPNLPGDPITHANNWFAKGVAELNKMPSYIARVDHTFSDAWKVYGRWNYNERHNSVPSGAHDYGTPAEGPAVSGIRSDGAAFDVVGILNPGTILNVRVGHTRLEMYSYYQKYDMASLGFPQSLVKSVPNPDRYPQFNLEGYFGIYNWDAWQFPSETYSVQANLLKKLASHSMKFGFEYRQIYRGSRQNGGGNGNYSFSRSWTSSNPQIDDPAGGNAVASFLLGYMSSAFVSVNNEPFYTWHYPVVYFQDEWQANRQVTLSLGLRWDYESPVTERYNRMNRGFDFTAKSPYQVPGLNLVGGPLFAGVGGQPRGAFDPDWNNVQPRFGVAYKMLKTKPAVFRAGIGRYFMGTGENGGEYGFGQTTYAQVSTPGYRPFHVLSDPFPDGLLPIQGASRGLATQVGEGYSFSDVNRVIPNVWHYSAGFEYELIPGTLVEASYVGSQTKQIQVSKSLNFLAVDQLALGTPYLSTSVPNPFYGVLPANTSLGAQANIQRRSLLVQYPHFTSLGENNMSLGNSWYNAFQIRLEQRFKHGLSLLVSYTNSKTMEAVSYLNPQNTALDRELVSFDVPQRLVISGLYEFPIGPHKEWVNKGIASHIIGGWQFNWTLLSQSGTPMSYPDYYINGNPKLSSGQTLDHWFNTSSSIWVQRPPDTLRVTPLRSPNIRIHSAPQLDVDLIRNFQITESHKLQFKASSYNVTNTPIFGAPDTSPTSPLFGVVPISQVNLPRVVELGFRYSF
jgi:carboxypeptidase family protein